MEGHEMVAYGWVCNWGDCQAAFRRLRETNISNHLKNHHKEEVEPMDLSGYPQLLCHA